jgi:HrpA-like RNA helicase
MQLFQVWGHMQEQKGLSLDMDIMQLHEAMPMADQKQVLEWHHGLPRRIVLSTDTAQTRVRVAAVTAVVDFGHTQAPFFDEDRGCDALKMV